MYAPNPLVVVEVTLDSHPFWTGDRRIVDTPGQVEKFHGITGGDKPLGPAVAEKVNIFHAFRPRGRETPRQTEGGSRSRLPAVDHNNESSLKG